MAVVGSDDQIVVPDALGEIRDVFIGLARHEKPVFPEQILAVGKFPSIGQQPAQDMDQEGRQPADASMKPKRKLGKSSGMPLWTRSLKANRGSARPCAKV